MPTTYEKRRQIAAWVADRILPHEGRMRSMLARSRVRPEDIDELIQEAYCRIAMLESVDHIDAPEAYFFSVTRNLLIRRLKRNQIVSLETVAEIEAYRDEAPSPEEAASSRADYVRMMDILASLPERCREVVRLRKIEGWPQKQIAVHLGMTEKAVEKQVWLGVKAIREQLGRERTTPSSDIKRPTSRWNLPK